MQLILVAWTDGGSRDPDQQESVVTHLCRIWIVVPYQVVDVGNVLVGIDANLVVVENVTCRHDCEVLHN